jgi:hypothetical protein
MGEVDIFRYFDSIVQLIIQLYSTDVYSCYHCIDTTEMGVEFAMVYKKMGSIFGWNQ